MLCIILFLSYQAGRRIPLMSAPTPSAPPASTPAAASPPPGAPALPRGWEARKDTWGRDFYIDHNTGTTHWDRPAASAAAAADDVKPSAPPSYGEVSPAPPPFPPSYVPQQNGTSVSPHAPGAVVFTTSTSSSTSYASVAPSTSVATTITVNGGNGMGQQLLVLAPGAPAAPISPSTSSLAALIPAAQFYANGAASEELRAAAAEEPVMTEEYMVNATGAGEACGYTCRALSCVCGLTVFCVILFIVMIFCAMRYAMLTDRDDWIAAADYIPGIFVPVMFIAMIYIIVSMLLYIQLNCAPCGCGGVSASLRNGAHTTESLGVPVAAGLGQQPVGTEVNFNAGSGNAAVLNPQAQRCCSVPLAFKSAMLTDRASLDDLAAHVERMRTAPIALTVRVKAGHTVRRGKHSHFVPTYWYVERPFCYFIHQKVMRCN